MGWFSMVGKLGGTRPDRGLIVELLEVPQWEVATWALPPHRSDTGDSHLATSGRREPLDVVEIAGQNHSLVAESHRHHDGVHHVRHFGLAQQSPRFVGLDLTERYDLAPG